MARTSSKLVPIRKNIKSVVPEEKPFGVLGPKVLKPRNTMVLPENTERGVKARVPVNIPGVKTR